MSRTRWCVFASNVPFMLVASVGLCVQALSEGKRPNYRDSALTLLLQSSMLNGRVYMIAAVSPSDMCRAESLSTLRFAERCKKAPLHSPPPLLSTLFSAQRLYVLAAGSQRGDGLVKWGSRLCSGSGGCLLQWVAALV